MMRRLQVVFLLFLLVPVLWSGMAHAGDDHVLFATSAGRLLVQLDFKGAPRNAGQVRDLVRNKAYDMAQIVRIEKGFVAQLAEVPGAPGPVPLENRSVRHLRGVLSMAHGDDPDSGYSSFSFLLGPAPHLDGHFTVFGRVVAGERALARLDSWSVLGPRPVVLRARMVEDAEVERLRQEIGGDPAEAAAAQGGLSALPAVGLLFGLMALLSLAAFALRSRAGQRTLVALHLLNLLLALLGLLVLLQPQGGLAGTLGVFALVGTFWLLSRFEATTPPSR